MVIEKILAEAGISKNHPEYGMEYNLCHAAIHGGLGIRNGSCQAVKDVISKHNLAPIDPKKMGEFHALITKMVDDLSPVKWLLDNWESHKKQALEIYGEEEFANISALVDRLRKQREEK